MGRSISPAGRPCSIRRRRWCRAGTSADSAEPTTGAASIEAREKLTGSPEAFSAFVGHCLDILQELRDAGVQHRDIRAENVLLRQGMPVLFDFGWATSRDLPNITPLYLGLSGRPPDGSFCDVFSMGTMIRALKGDRLPEWDSLLRLMTEPDARCRLTDLDALRLLAAAAAGRAGRATGGDMDDTDSGGTSGALTQLADKAAALSQRAVSQESRITELEQDLLKRQEAIDVLSARIFEVAGVLEQKEGHIGELRAALGTTQIALAEGRAAQATQAQYVAYLEKEVHAHFWRKAIAYLRRRMRGS